MRKPKENRNCPYCLSEIGKEDERVRCPKCGVLHHRDCWQTNGKCSVYGCDGWALWSNEISERIAPDADGPVDVSADDAVENKTAETARCMRCGKEVRSDQLLCWNCQLTQKGHRWDNCAGPSVILVGGVVGIVTLIVRALI